MSNEIKLLYIDDEKINLLLFHKLMGKKYTVITADGGEKGLELLDQDPSIQYIISDLVMPRMSGLEFIKEAHKRYSNKYYFMLTGYAINDDIQAALDAKIILQYFMKPANFEEIDSALQRYPL
jgi:two-component system response regulator (stage 0 sporulation protein F)